MEEGKAKGGGWDGEDQHVHTAAVERTVTSSMGGVRAGVMSPVVSPSIPTPNSCRLQVQSQ